MDTPAVNGSTTVDARLDVAQRVAASGSFHRAPRLRELLLYICERATQNRLPDLREQQIGCAVFGRKPDYNPGEDNIVRVEIRQLRKRLEEYFATEGKDDPFVILIPKGAYVPVFEPREAVRTAVASGEQPAAQAVGVFRIRTSWLQPAAIVMLAVGCLWMWIGNRRAEQRVAAASSSFAHDRAPLWTLLFNEGQQTFLVCADSSLVPTQQILHRSISLEEYLKGDYSAKTGGLSTDDNALVRSLRMWQFTDITDVRLVQRLYGLNADHWDKVSVRTARTAQIQDFKNGNSILLGSVRSNPWNRLFEPLLNFVFEFDEPTRTSSIHNKAPLAGERSVYRAAKTGESGETYSVITLVPNLRHTGSVLIIAGTSGEGTEAAGEFIMNGKASIGLMETLIQQHKGRIPYFEVLLHSGTLAGAAKNAEVIAYRILSD
jgi:hypothetical protein